MKMITLIYEFDNDEFELKVEFPIGANKMDLFIDNYDKAYEAYLEAKEMRKDIHAYHGVSRGDF